MIRGLLCAITIGAIITGLAHLFATFAGSGKYGVDLWGELGITTAGFSAFAHRVIVLIGFIVLVMGFQKLRAIKR